MELTEAQRQYAGNWVRMLISSELDPTAIPKELLELVFRDLSRQEEAEQEFRDQWGNWPWPYSQTTREGTLYVPRVDVAVLKWAKSCGIIRRAAKWPFNKPFAVCLTHDVDFISRRSTSLQYLAELARRSMKVPCGKWKVITSQFSRHVVKYLAGPILRLLREDEYHNFDTCMEMEAQYGYKSTFLIFAEKLPSPHVLDCGYSHQDRVRFFGAWTTVRLMLQEMVDRGWDIGLHGSYLSAVELSALLEEKRQVEESAAVPIVAIRHHYLHYDPCKTPFLHEQAGFHIDSTMGFNRNIGFRAGTAFPFPCWDHTHQQATTVLQCPLHIMDGALIQTSGLGCPPSIAARYINLIMNQVEEVGGCLMVNWHPSWLSMPNYLETYRLILEEAKLRGAWGCTLRELASLFREFSV